MLIHILLSIIILLLLIIIILIIRSKNRVDQNTSFLNSNIFDLDMHLNSRINFIENFLSLNDIYWYMNIFSTYEKYDMYNEKFRIELDWLIKSWNNEKTEETIKKIVLNLYNIKQNLNYQDEIKNIYRKTILWEIKFEEWKSILKTKEYREYFEVDDFIKEQPEYFKKEYENIKKEFSI